MPTYQSLQNQRMSDFMYFMVPKRKKQQEMIPTLNDAVEFKSGPFFVRQMSCRSVVSGGPLLGMQKLPVQFPAPAVSPRKTDEILDSHC